MKKTILYLMLGLFSLEMYAQDYVPNRDEIEAFFHTKTLVVLQDNPLLEYNMIMRKVMEQEWNITEFDFITFSEFDKKRKDPQYSFIYQSSVTFENDKTDARYRFLHLSLGGDYFRKNQMPDLASIPLAFYGVEEDKYIYKLGLLVRFMQNHAKLIKEKPEIVSQNVFKYYNENIKDIQGKTLYLLEEELSKSVNSAARIKKLYPYKFEIVTKEDIQKAIKEKNEDIVFLHKVGPEGTKVNARCYKIILGAGDDNFYYFNYHKISGKKPDGILPEDFKRLAK